VCIFDSRAKARIQRRGQSRSAQPFFRSIGCVQGRFAEALAVPRLFTQDDFAAHGREGRE
jgi:hypothetical protein